MFKSYFLGLTWFLFWLFCIYTAQFSIAAVWAINIYFVWNFLVICKVINDNKILDRPTWPWFCCFSTDSILAAFAVYIGGWLTLAGILIFLIAQAELMIYGEITISRWPKKETEVN